MPKIYAFVFTWLFLIALPALSQEPEPAQPTAEDQEEPDPFADPEMLGDTKGLRLQFDPKQYRWSAGNPPVKIMHRSEGFCFLSAIEGALNADTDSIRVFVGDDGFWYLSGTATARGSKLAAMAIAIRYVTPTATEIGSLPESIKDAPQEESAGGTPVADADPLALKTTGEPDAKDSIPQVEFRGKRLEVKLPAQVGQAKLGGGDKYLICSLGKLGKLAIFDVELAKVVKYLSVGADPGFAAGRDKLVVLNLAQRKLERYELGGEFKLELSVDVPVKPAIHELTMGADSAGPILAHVDLERSASARNFNLLDLETLKPLDVHYEGIDFDIQHRVSWASANGKLFGLADPSSSNSGMTTLTLRAKRAIYRHQDSGVGYVIPGLDGTSLYTSKGVLGADFGVLNQTDNGASYFGPIQHPAFYFGVNCEESPDRRAAQPATMAVYGTSDNQKLFTLPVLPELSLESRGYIGWQTFRGASQVSRLFMLPLQKRLVTISDKRDSIFIRHFDVVALMELADIDYLFVSSIPPRSAEPSVPYSYPIAVSSRRGQPKFTLESGPDGMQLSPAGVITWTPPDDFFDVEVGVIVRIADASGKEMFHSYMLHVLSK